MVCANGLAGRKKGNRISLVAFVKSGGADGSARCFCLSLKSAVTCHFYAEKCLIRLNRLQNKKHPSNGKKWQCQSPLW